MMNTRDHGGGVYGINMDCSIVCVCGNDVIEFNPLSKCV